MVIYHIKVFTYENIALFIKRLFMTAASAIERFNFVAPKKQDVFLFPFKPNENILYIFFNPSVKLVAL